MEFHEASIAEDEQCTIPGRASLVHSFCQTDRELLVELHYGPVCVCVMGRGGGLISALPVGKNLAVCVDIAQIQRGGVWYMLDARTRLLGQFKRDISALAPISTSFQHSVAGRV